MVIRLLCWPYSRIGVTILFISKGSLWEQIPGLKIPGFGFARIEAVCAKSTHWIEEKKPVKVGRVESAKYKQIVDAIYGLFMGNINDSIGDSGLVYNSWDDEGDQGNIIKQEGPIDEVPPVVDDIEKLQDIEVLSNFIEEFLKVSFIKNKNSGVSISEAKKIFVEKYGDIIRRDSIFANYFSTIAWRLYKTKK